jgi:uncharacterized repeat protein (TIGR03803 family)
LLAALAAITGPAVSQAGTFKTLHQFTNYPTDGAYPMGDLTVLNGQLYGTTSEGGSRGNGVVFNIDPTTGVETVIHAFNGTDGSAPYAGLLAWHDKLYGTSLVGGVYGEGSVFETDPATGDTTLLHSFFGDDGNDGEAPAAALIEYEGKLYGTTVNGGGIGEGTVFGLNPTTKAEFVAVYFVGGSNGGNPSGRLLKRNGLLYGTTSQFAGIIFSLDVVSGKFKALAQFDDYHIYEPFSGLTADGNTFYGTASGGGRYDLGSVYSFKASSGKLKPNLHAFRDTHRDGQDPVSDLVLVNGTLYGTASAGGKSGQGIVFGINIATKAETILHEFTGGSDGGDPVAGLVFYNGALYGTTYSGAQGYGTVFEVKP